MIDIKRKVVVISHNVGYGKRIMSERFTKKRHFEGMAAK